MIRWTLIATLALSAPAAAQMLDGSFTLRESSDGRTQLKLQYSEGRGQSNYGRTIERSDLTDLTRTGDRITFQLRRAAGTFSFEGKGSLDRAAGWYEFTPDAGFRRELEGLGFRGIEGTDMFVFALDDLTTAKTRTLLALVSDRIDTDDLVRMINHGASVAYVQSMTDLGFRDLSSAEYVRARDHGVSASFAREMRELGMRLPLSELIRSRDHGVTADYVRQMRTNGVELSHDEYIRSKDHGVSADFIKDMHALGHRVSHSELVRARDHGVSAAFVREFHELGYDDLPLSEYVRLRDHGVSPAFVESLQKLGYRSLKPSELVKLKNHGITAAYVRRAKDIFRETPSVEQIVRLRTRGDIGTN